MTNAEHLIENALYATHLAFKANSSVVPILERDIVTVEQAKAVGISLGDVADMAEYVYFNVMDEEARNEFIEGINHKGQMA